MTRVSHMAFGVREDLSTLKYSTPFFGTSQTSSPQSLDNGKSLSA